MFEKAGVEPFEPGYTYEDYLEKARQIHEALGIYASNSYLLNDNIDGFCSYLRQHGTDLYYGPGFEDADISGTEFKELGYSDDSLFVDFHKMELKMVQEGVFAHHGLLVLFLLLFYR